MDITNGLFSDAILLIFPYIKWYNQSNFAQTCKLLYNKYCEYKKRLEKSEYKKYSSIFKKNNITRDSIMMNIYADGTTSSFEINGKYELVKTLNTNLPHNYFSTHRTGKIVSGFMGITLFNGTIQMYPYVKIPPTTTHLKNIQMIDLLNWNKSNIVNMNKYNKLKTKECPNVNDFRAWSEKVMISKFYDDSYPDGLSFGHLFSINYCSIDQHKNEIMALHKLFQMYDNLILIK